MVTVSPENTTFLRLRRALAELVHVDEHTIRPETRLAHLIPPVSGATDSLEAVEFSMWLEEQFEIAGEVAEAEVEALERILKDGTVQDLADFLDRLR